MKSEYSNLLAEAAFGWSKEETTLWDSRLHEEKEREFNIYFVSYDILHLFIPDEMVDPEHYNALQIHGNIENIVYKYADSKSPSQLCSLIAAELAEYKYDIPLRDAHTCEFGYNWIAKTHDVYKPYYYYFWKNVLAVTIQWSEDKFHLWYADYENCFVNHIIHEEPTKYILHLMHSPKIITNLDVDWFIFIKKLTSVFHYKYVFDTTYDFNKVRVLLEDVLNDYDESIRRNPPVPEETYLVIRSRPFFYRFCTKFLCEVLGWQSERSLQWVLNEEKQCKSILRRDNLFKFISRVFYTEQVNRMDGRLQRTVIRELEDIMNLDWPAILEENWDNSTIKKDVFRILKDHDIKTPA